MSAADQSFTITFKTVAELTGLDRFFGVVQSGAKKVEEINTQLRSVAATANTALTALGSVFALSKLDEYAKKAAEVREGQAAFAMQVFRSADGSKELLDQLTKLNVELATTTGTSEGTSRAIERQLLLFGATKKTIEPLTRGIIDFAAARGKDVQEVAMFISRAIAGEDIQLGRLGIHLDKTKSHAEQVQSLIEQLGKTAGTAAVMEQAAGGLAQYRIAWEKLTIAIGNAINLVRIPFLVGLVSGLQGAKSALDQTTGSANEFGRSVFVTSGMVGHWVGENLNLIGSVATLGGALVLLRTSLGLIGPQATIAAAALIGLSFGYSALTEKILGVPLTITEAYGLALRQTQTTFDAIGKVIAGLVRVFTSEIDGLVAVALTKLIELAKASAGLLNTLSLGTINIDTSALDAKLGELKQRAVKDAGEIKTGVNQVLDTAVDANLKLYNDFQVKLDEIKKRSTGASNTKEELNKAYDEYAKNLEAIQARFANQKGTGVIGGIDESGAKNAKAATDALTRAKFALSSAEQTYKTKLEETKLLEDSGQLSHDQANARNIQATRDYIAELERAKAALPGLIAQLNAIGNTKGAAEAKLEFQQLTNKILEAQITLSNSSFFGKMRSQIRQLANEWGDLGKQIGGFLTQAFQNFASTAATAITGLIFRTGNWKQAILQLGQSFVQSMIQMVIQWILSRTIMSALNKAFGAADAAATKAQAGGAAAAWAPAATAASIASYGAAAGTGLAAYLSALGVGTAATLGAAQGGGFQGGGFTGFGRDNEPAGTVHRNEVVFPAPRVRELGRDWLVNMAVGNIARPGYQSGGLVGGGGVAPAGAANAAPEFYFFHDFDAAMNAFQKSASANKHFRVLRDRNQFDVS